MTYFLRAFLAPDLDFGWQLKNGQALLSSGFFYKDIYSYSMPSYPLALHSWLSEILMAIIFKYFNFAGLAFIFVSITLGMLLGLFYYLQKNYPRKFFSKAFVWYLSYLIASVTVIFGFFYARPQNLTWLLWTFFVVLITQKRLYLKFRLLLPILFLLWANLHGGFALPLFLLAFSVGFEILVRRKIDFIDVLVVISSFAATLINPYGMGLWREVFLTYFNPYLREGIGEWSPAFLGYFDLSLIFMMVFSSFMVWRYRKHFELKLMVIYVFLLLQAILSIKNIPFWVIFSFIFTFQTIYLFYKELPNKIAIQRFEKAGILVLIFTISAFLAQSALSFAILIYRPYVIYPDKAVAYLKSNLPKEEVFSTFNWGGYLVWKFPVKKVFINGMMDTWTWNTDLPRESNNAFAEYWDMLSGKENFNKAAEKYGIDTILWDNTEGLDRQSFSYRFDEWTCKYLNWGCFYLYHANFSKILEKDGWKVIYKDRVSVIYKK